MFFSIRTIVEYRKFLKLIKVRDIPSKYSCFDDIRRKSSSREQREVIPDFELVEANEPCRGNAEIDELS